MRKSCFNLMCSDGREQVGDMWIKSVIGERGQVLFVEAEEELPNED